jgi:hypothetical protein
MDLKDAVKHFGSQNQLAKALGIARQNITRWVNDGIPELQKYRLEEITQGKLKRNGVVTKAAGRGKRSD